MLKQKNNTEYEMEIRIHAQPKFLCVVRSAVRKTAEITGLNEQEADRVTLAMEEALTNAIKHSYGGPCSKPIVVKVRKLETQEKDCPGLEIIVRDYGRQVDPATIKSRNLNQVKPGGLGVHIIHSFMDETEYTCPVEGGMQVRMVKYHDPSENVQTACSVGDGR